MKGRAEVRGDALGELLLPGAVQVVEGVCRNWEWRTLEAAPLDATIDTGASRSCVPRGICDGSRGAVLREVDSRRPDDWRGRPAPRGIPIYLLRVRVLGMGPYRVLAYVRDAEEFLLGRDLLRHLLLALDGPVGAFRLRRTSSADRWLRRALRCP